MRLGRERAWLRVHVRKTCGCSDTQHGAVGPPARSRVLSIATRARHTHHRYKRVLNEAVERQIALLALIEIDRPVRPLVS
jgi:hypothetical protein